MQKRKQKPAEAKDNRGARRLQDYKVLGLNMMPESAADATHEGCDVDLSWTQSLYTVQKNSSGART